MSDDAETTDLLSKKQPAGKKGRCGVTNEMLPRRELVPIGMLHPALAERLHRSHPG